MFIDFLYKFRCASVIFRTISKNTLTGIIDVAMVGSMYSKGKFNDLINSYGMVIMDDERVIIRTKLEKPSKIKGLALI